MKTLAKWCVPLMVMAGLIAVASNGRWLAAQESGKAAKEDKGSKGDKAEKGDKGDKEKPSAERIAAFRKAFADTKTTLVQAITAAETQTKGKAHTAEFHLSKDGKLELYVGVVAADKLQVATIDPATGKVTKVKDQGDDDDDDDDAHH